MAQTKRSNRRIDSYDGNAARKIAVREVKENKRKLNIVRLNEKQLRQSRRQGTNPIKTVASIVVVSLAFTLIASIIYGQVQLTELTSRINAATTSLSELESVEIQLQMKANSSLDVNEIVNYAQTNLGMEKIKNSQVSYINLVSKDQGVVVEETTKGFFSSTWDLITSWLS